MPRALPYIVFFFVALTLGLATKASADFYKYIDEEGKLHVTNNPLDSKYMWYMKERTRAEENGTGKTLKNASYPTLYDDMIQKHAINNGIDPALIKAVIKAESNFNPLAVSKQGAMGLMQLMPETARILGVTNVYDPAENVEAGTRHLRGLLSRFGWNLTLAVAAYNAGGGAVERYGTVPPYKETQTYVERVLRYHRLFKTAARY